MRSMYINVDANLDSYSQKNYGLFAKVRGTIKNLTIDQSYICVSGGGKNVGTVAGSTVLDEARIENCVSNAVIETYDGGNAGGIVGIGWDSTITGCQFGGSITQLDEQWSHLGGICGNGGKISSCTNLGIISGSGYSGGTTYYTTAPGTVTLTGGYDREYYVFRIKDYADVYICGEEISWDPIGPGTGVWIKILGNYFNTYGEYWLTKQ